MTEDTTVTKQAFSAKSPVIFYLDVPVTREPRPFTSDNFAFHGLAKQRRSDNFGKSLNVSQIVTIS